MKFLKVASFFSLFCIFFIACFFYGRQVSAFSLTPAVVDIAIDPGSSHVEFITITNDESTVQTYRLSIQRFIPKGDSGQQEFLPITETDGLPSWVSFDSSMLSLNPGETRRIPVIIRVPVDTRGGGYYAALFFSRERKIEPVASGVSAGLRVGVLFFVNVRGSLMYQGNVPLFSLLTESKLLRLPVRFDVVVKNDGNVHFSPQGTINIVNIFGRRVASLPINQAHARVLPGSLRRFSVSWYKAESTDGSGFFFELREQMRNFGFGPYRARLTFTDTFIQSNATSELFFTVYPFHLIITVFFLLIVLFLVFRWYRRWVLYRARI